MTIQLRRRTAVVMVMITEIVDRPLRVRSENVAYVPHCIESLDVGLVGEFNPGSER